MQFKTIRFISAIFLAPSIVLADLPANAGRFASARTNDGHRREPVYATQTVNVPTTWGLTDLAAAAARVKHTVGRTGPLNESAARLRFAPGPRRPAFPSRFTRPARLFVTTLAWTLVFIPWAGLAFNPGHVITPRFDRAWLALASTALPLIGMALARRRANPEEDASKPVILIVEDDQNFRHGLERFLSVVGELDEHYEFVLSDGEEQAWNLFRHLRTDGRRVAMIITDVRMKHSSGNALVKKIVAVDPDLPVVFQTATPESVSEFLSKLPNVRVISKMDIVAELVALIRSLLPVVVLAVGSIVLSLEHRAPDRHRGKAAQVAA